MAELLIVLSTGLMLAYSTLFLCVLPLTDLAGLRDYVVFWSTGQQLAHHANPYDEAGMMRLEHEAGLPAMYRVGYMRNPPWGLALAFPLGFLGLRAGAFFWTLLLMACLALSVFLLWRLYGRPRGALHWLGISFAPALLCVTMGQTSVFALLGYVLFLDLHKRKPFLAGVSLWLCALKPHLFLAFGVVLLAWVVVSRSYKILAGAMAAMAANCALVTAIDPAAWGEYLRMMRAGWQEKELIPCLSVMLRLQLSPHTMALGYLPAALGCAWALVYYWRKRREWEWAQDGSLPLLVSLLTTPYAWIYDDCIAIPALLQGAYIARMRWLISVLALGTLAIEAELICGMKMASYRYLWTAPVWLGWYLCARYLGAPKATAVEAITVPELL